MAGRIEQLRWLTQELRYADAKWAAARPQHDEAMREEGVEFDGRWVTDLLGYVKRAQVLGLDNPLGRQALMKGLAVYWSMCESMTRVHGDPPPPGAPSGEQ